MQCTKCKNTSSQVIASVKITGSSKVLRTRKCRACGHKFQTTEEPNKSDS